MRDTKTGRARAFGSRTVLILKLGLTVATALLCAAALILSKALPMSIDTYNTIQYAYALNDYSVVTLIFMAIAVYLAEQ